MLQRSWQLPISHIIEAIERVQQYTQGISP